MGRSLAPPKGKRRRTRVTVSRIGYHTKASAVTVTHADGTVETKPAYSPEQLRRIVKLRPKISARQRARIFERDGHRCRYCGCRAAGLEIEHVIPIALGGTNSIRNLVTSCRPCNERKGIEIWRPRPPP